MAMPLPVPARFSFSHTSVSARIGHFGSNGCARAITGKARGNAENCSTLPSRFYRYIHGSLKARLCRAGTGRGHPRALLRRVLRTRRSSGGFSSRQFPIRPDEMTGIAFGITLEVVLVIGLGFPEVAGWRNLGHHLARPQPRSIDIGDHVLGDPLLFIARVKDC